MAVKEDNEGGKKTGGGWIKTVLGMVGGMLSGAVVMYATAWLDNAVKPAKPVPNFRVQHEGCTVTFQNLSPGYTGWWDFGDGSELVPVTGDSDSLVHKYDQPGDYNVKLSSEKSSERGDGASGGPARRGAGGDQAAEDREPYGGGDHAGRLRPGHLQDQRRDGKRPALSMGLGRRPAAGGRQRSDQAPGAVGDVRQAARLPRHPHGRQRNRRRFSNDGRPPHEAPRPVP